MSLVMSETTQEAHPHWTATLISITGDITHASGDITTEPGNITGDITRGYPPSPAIPTSIACDVTRKHCDIAGGSQFNVFPWIQRFPSLQCFISLECWTSPRREEVLHMFVFLYFSSFSSVSKLGLTFKAFLDFQSFP